jgi:Tol biopolymer transport system component
LDTGVVLDLTGAVTSFNWHATTRAAARAGWGYAATNDNTGSPLDGEIYSIKLDGSGMVQRYAHHRSNNIDYDSAPLPTPSPDGRRALFGSNWGAANGRPVQAYVVDTRQLCPNGLPQ